MTVIIDFSTFATKQLSHTRPISGNSIYNEHVKGREVLNVQRSGQIDWYLHLLLPAKAIGPVGYGYKITGCGSVLCPKVKGAGPLSLKSGH